MIKILANDGLAAAGVSKIQDAGLELTLEKIPQSQLGEYLERAGHQALIVRSATQVTKDIIDQATNLKFIGRAGVGLDNIDVAYAQQRGITVANTPAASTNAVAELVFAHLFTLMRNLHNTNQRLPLGDDFKALKRASSSGLELQGKTLGIWGFGRIGQAVAKKALGLDMHILAYDPFIQQVDVEWSIQNQQPVRLSVETVDLDTLLTSSDIITFHVPKPERPLVTAQELQQMKDGIILINTARGEVFAEQDLMAALIAQKVALAGIDVFHHEPTPNIDLMKLPNVSVSPHIGGETQEAQERISLEMAEKIIAFFSALQ